MNNRCLYFILAGILLLASSCLETDRNLYVKLTRDQYFDFNLNQEVAVNIDYGFASKDYVILFELYAQDPLEEKADGTIGKIEGITPLYRAATDGSGKYSGSIQILSEYSEVWLHSDYPGVVTPVKLDITNQSISFNQKAYVAGLSTTKTRALTPNKRIYPDSWKVLGDWNENGTPDYLLPQLATPPPGTLYSIKDIYSSTPVGGKFITDRYPKFFDGKMTSDINIVKPTKVRLAFITSTASWNNAVGYFTYDTKNPPKTIEEMKKLQKILAFPNASPVIKNLGGRGALLCNHQIQLKYWDGKEFKEEFPAGISIGWFLEGDGFNLNTGKVEEKNTRYSITELNTPGEDAKKTKQRTVSLKDKNSTQIVAIGFEDNKDMKFNDACFYLDIEQKDAIDVETPELPEVTPPTNIENWTKSSGTLSFEDKWPTTADFDMNDIIVKYYSTIYRTIVGNRIYKIVDEFVPYHNGGVLHTGFGYQLSTLSPSDIKSVTIEGGVGPSKYMEGKMLEPGQTYPTILVFDDIFTALGKTIKVTIEVNDAKIEDKQIIPPYNPFIFVESNNKGRGVEVHLPKYRPTDKADASLFGTQMDGSRPEEDLYYVVSHWLPQMPFAINLPNTTDFPIPEETVDIRETYPNFSEWVSSGGTKNRDWYKKPAKK